MHLEFSGPPSHKILAVSIQTDPQLALNWHTRHSTGTGARLTRNNTGRPQVLPEVVGYGGPLSLYGVRALLVVLFPALKQVLPSLVDRAEAGWWC